MVGAHRRRPRVRLQHPPKRATDDERKQQLEYAKQVDEYSEYALYVLALKAQPKDEVDLVDTLIKQNPKSQYLPEVANSYFAALGKAGESAKVCPAADKDGRGQECGGHAVCRRLQLAGESGSSRGRVMPLKPPKRSTRAPNPKA